ncbi:MAG: site-specific recombinase [Gammaproteobacteria bacterium]|nr:site-specific recombinase [Gammaproteobacteria bacterium]MDX5375484.1 site-specific recombinase [Gammaproteobacteria bacterium]
MARPRLETLLDRVVEDETLDAVDTLTQLVDWLRPDDPEHIAPVIARIEELAMSLESRSSVRHALSGRVQGQLLDSRHLPLYTEIGLFSRRGFFRELGTRIYERLNPAPADRRNLKHVLTIVFHRLDDPEWVTAVPDDAWLRLFDLLIDVSEGREKALRRAREEALYALETLSTWIAAEELEPELLRLDPRICERNSAFVAQQRELAVYVREYLEWTQDSERPFHDDEHARVLLEQVAEQISLFRKRAVKRGTSIGLTYLLERLDQTLERIENLLDLLDPDDAEKRRSTGVRLFKQMVVNNARRHSLRALWQENVKLLSRSVTENASHTGEHYITRNRAEYLQMLWSGAGAGLIIAFMALIKLEVVELGLSRGLQTLLVCLNYGLGFVLIHILHFTVATKQPAMTAARFAAAVEQGDRGMANLKKLADLMIDVGRSQFVAVLGNVLVALPVAILVGWAYLELWHTPVLDAQAANYQIKQLSPITGLALFHAAIAGLWLFVSGLIAGFFDNRCAYLDLPGRLREHPLLRRIIPTGLRERIADYIDGNYGALAGNFFFGVLLGVTGYIGYLLSLPLDIRHIAFSSANLGYVVAGGMPGWGDMTLYFIFVLLIGAMNLWVSFALAFWVALKARGARIGSVSRLLRVYLQRIAERPRELLLPPPPPPETAPPAGDRDRK